MFPGAITPVTAGADGTNLSSYSTASVTLKANKLYLVHVTARQASGTIDHAAITVSGGGTWAQIASGFPGDVSGLKGCATFRCVPSSDYTGALTIGFAATQDACQWSVIKTTRAVITNNGADGLAQVVVYKPAAASNPSITMSAFGSVNNGSIGFFSLAASPSGSKAERLYDILTFVDSAGAGIQTTAVGKAGPDTSISVTQGNLADWFCVGLEIVWDGTPDDAPYIHSIGDTTASGVAGSVVLPDHATGDVIIIPIETATGEAITTPSGWGVVANSPQDNATELSRISLLWKRATSASETNPSIADPGNHWVGAPFVIRGCVTGGDPWNVTAGGTHGSGTGIQITGLTPTVDRCLVLHFVGSGRNNSAFDNFDNFDNPDLEDYMEVFDEIDTIGSGGGFGVGRGYKMVAGAVGVATVDIPALSSNGGGHVTVALMPPLRLTPSTPALTITGYAPTVTVGGAGTTATPGTAALTVTGPAPTATASDHKTVTPATASISISSSAPTVAQGFLWDTFTDTEKALVSHAGELATWALHPSFTSEARISDENRARGTTPESRPLADQAPPAAEYRILFRIHVKSASGASGITFRHHATADTAYILTYQALAKEWSLSRFIASAVVTLAGPYGADPLNAGDSRSGVIEVRSGGSMRVLLEGVEILSATDTGITATGQIGMRFGTASNTTAAHWDEIRAVTIADVAVTPSTAALSLTGYAPTVTGGGGGGASVEPGTAALTLTGPAPTATASDHKSATPATAALTVTGPAPTVSVSANQTAEPGTASLSLTGAAPTVETPTAVATGAAVLELSGAAPTIETPVTATPGTASLELAGFAPTVSGAISADPGVGALVLTGPAPSVALTDHQTASPGAAGLSLTAFPPTVDLTVSAEPATASVVLTGPAPTVEITSGLTVVPGIALLELAGPAPTVTATANVVAAPGAASLELTGPAPAIQLSDHRTVTPATASIVLTGPAPAVEVTADRTVEPGVASIVLTGPAPTVLEGDNAEADPGVASLTISSSAPTAVATAHVLAAPSVGALTLTGPGPSVLVSAHRTVFPGVAGVLATGFAPAVSVSAHILATPGVGLILATGYAPEVTGVVPRGVAQLVAEREIESSISGGRGLTAALEVERDLELASSADRDITLGLVAQRDDEDTLTAEA